MAAAGCLKAMWASGGHQPSESSVTWLPTPGTLMSINQREDTQDKGTLCRSDNLEFRGD